MPATDRKIIMNAQQVLDFWFGAPGSETAGQPRREWFVKSEAFDEQIRRMFGAAIDQAVAGGLREWDAEGPQGVLARILVLDQFTRNAYRNTPRSFEGDPLALAAARQLVDSGADKELPPWQRSFVYMPFEHAEDAFMQERAVELFSVLAADHPGFDESLDYAHRHRGIIARFGRFPHRNEILGRASTPEEIEFLRQPGSRF
ncbi:membrane protein [Massilia sp. WF1]|nr:membrane protein [Massilia sp. WF1]